MREQEATCVSAGNCRYPHVCSVPQPATAIAAARPQVMRSAEAAGGLHWLQIASDGSLHCLRSTAWLQPHVLSSACFLRGPLTPDTPKPSVLYLTP